MQLHGDLRALRHGSSPAKPPRAPLAHSHATKPTLVMGLLRISVLGFVSHQLSIR